MEKIVAHFAQCENVKVYLFGGGTEEINLLEEWASKYKGVTSLAGKMSLSDELEQLAAMNLVLSMDSANMHLASLAGVPVLCIWGATHPFAGFTGWKQPPTNSIQVDLPCRPCSVYGNKNCYRRDYACMDIPEQLIIEKITALLAGNR
jgi:ADP-heptose:LPS heptosyltransferase